MRDSPQVYARTSGANQSPGWFYPRWLLDLLDWSREVRNTLVHQFNTKSTDGRCTGWSPGEGCRPSIPLQEGHLQSSPHAPLSWSSQDSVPWIFMEASLQRDGMTKSLPVGDQLRFSPPPSLQVAGETKSPKPLILPVFPVISPILKLWRGWQP